MIAVKPVHYTFKKNAIIGKRPCMVCRNGRKKEASRFCFQKKGSIMAEKLIR